MIDNLTAIGRLVDRLRSRSTVSDDDAAAFAALPVKVRTINASQYIVREGQLPQRCGFICDGFAYRQKLTLDGDRQIVMLLVPGDMIDLQNLFLSESDHDVQALTAMTVAEVPTALLGDLVVARPLLGRAFWTEALVEASIQREWLLNVGRRNAKARIAHFLCEFQCRLTVTGTDEDAAYDLPMTQEQLGDALGLTPVHVNRMLQSLERDGLIERRQRRIRVGDGPQLRRAGQFNPRYLHLPPAPATPNE